MTTPKKTSRRRTNVSSSTAAAASPVQTPGKSCNGPFQLHQLPGSNDAGFVDAHTAAARVFLYAAATGTLDPLTIASALRLPDDFVMDVVATVYESTLSMERFYWLKQVVALPFDFRLVWNATHSMVRTYTALDPFGGNILVFQKRCETR